MAQSLSPKTRGSVPLTLAPPSLHANSIFCFTDAAWRADQKAVGLAWIFLNQDSTEISRESSFQTAVSSPLMAEALAIRRALLHASASGLNLIWLRSDSQGLIKAINSNLRSIELYGVLSDVDSIISSASLSVSFSFIPRDCNGVADSLTKSCLFLNLSS
ncbi:PREDICTED: uncharacterized protein LOC106314517 [Brassica oleracea var. oleracea]|uniref:uncharacterized protein LOC106314517 n=1 Tax=Brassica oleracea var. oleracea TaxID=109376 RepID=UPI0006A71EA0|nr:PREDICTED: uncharacterized protein LOC106314517 [Brassica oleracea var. oleracea]